MSSEHMLRILWAPPHEQAESDCACSDVNMAPAMLHSPLAGYTESDCACPAPAVVSVNVSDEPAVLWQISPRLYRVPLPGTYELVFNPANPVSVVMLNEPAYHLLGTFAVPQPLTNATARQLATLGLLSSNYTPQHATRDASATLSSTVRTANTQHTLTAWLHLTNQCNLRCTYCYTPRNNERMSAETGRMAVETTFRTALAHGFCAVKLKYAGGEPTLNFPVVQAAHAHAQALAARHNLKLRAVLLSNGTVLTDAMMNWLCGENVRLMISLDGISATHNVQRPFANGRGSFAQVARNIDSALSHGLSPHLSITATARNANGLANAVTFALERDLPFNLNFVRELGTGAYHRETDHIHLIAGVRAAFAIIEAILPRRRLIDALVDRSAFSAPHEYPCGVGRNYLTIDPQGRVARCQMTMDQSVTDIWTDDLLPAVRGWRDGFQNVSVDEKEDCSDCTWRYWCAGGCPLLAYHVTGRSDVPSPYCAVYRALFPDLLRLEGLRLLKWQPPST